MPLGLGSVGAYVAADHDVRFLLPDTRAFRGDPWPELRRAIADEKPDVVGVTAVTAQVPAARRVARIARELGATTVLGGVHASATGERPPEFDLLVRGEGEAPLRAILDGEPPGRIPGVVWEGGATPAAPPLADLDALPFPKRDGLVWTEDVHPALYQGLVTLRGCPYSCAYCAVPGLDARKTRFRSPGNVADEIAALRARWHVPYLFFHDSVFTLHRKRTLALCRELVARDLVLPFTCQTRADRLDDEVLDALAAAGCRHVMFGIESGDAETLRRIHKDVSPDRVRAAVAATLARGMQTTGFFMIGFPWETREAILRTADFAVEVGVDSVSLFSAVPLPGTELWEIAGADVPVAIDFRAPSLNLTRIPDYAALFAEVKARLTAYNEARVRARIAAVPTPWVASSSSSLPSGTH